MDEIEVTIDLRDAQLSGDLMVPAAAAGIVVFAHGSGSSRHSPRNREVAAALQEAGMATLLFDLLTAAEEQVDVRTREHRFDIDLLARRLAGVTHWIGDDDRTTDLAIGYFGASTGAAAALVAASQLPDQVAAVVSRGGRPDLAGDALGGVRCPVQLIVGGDDVQVLELNRQAAAAIPGAVQLEVVPGAGHLFEEPGALEHVSALAGRFLGTHLARRD